MANPIRKGAVNSTTTAARSINEGLRAYMLKIYNLMALGLTVTGAIAYYVGNTPEILHMIYGTPLQWVVMLAPLGLVMFLGFRLQSMSVTTAQAVYWLYASLMGLSLSYIFVRYPSASIARAFFISAGTFGAMSLYGYTTKKDLTAMGSFLFMGLIGLVIASLVNLFLKSSALSFITSLIGVLVFTGLTAYDTQKLKLMYSANRDSAMGEKLAIYGALQLYLDFINIFLSLLRLMGDRK